MADNLIVGIERMKKSELSHVVDIARKEIYPVYSKIDKGSRTGSFIQV